MRIVPQLGKEVKEFTSGGALTPGEQDRATLESDLSGFPGPSGASAPPVLDTPFRNPPEGLKAINSPATGEVSTKPAPDSDSDVSSKSLSPPVALFLRPANSDTPEITEIVESFRVYCSGLENSPGTFIHLKHKTDGSTALYRANRSSYSRYFPEGRMHTIRKLGERLSNRQFGEGVFFTLTVDAKRYSLTEAWTSMWKEWNRFKDALNIYRKRHMNATHGILYLAVLEQNKSGYPHLHVYCPGLDWLVKRQDLGKMDDWWGMGYANTKKEREQDSARGYVVKYISKLDGWSEVSMALIWRYKIRIYNLSDSYYAEQESGEWELLGKYTNVKDLAQGLGMGIKAAEELLDAFADCEDNLVYLT